MDSTERAMVEIPSSVFKNDSDWMKPSRKTVLKDVNEEKRRLHLYAHPEESYVQEDEDEDSEDEELKNIRLESLNTELSFAEPLVTSTQKPRGTQIVAETVEEHESEPFPEIEESQPFPDAQPLVGSSVRQQDITSSTVNSNDRSYSPHPEVSYHIYRSGLIF